MATRVDGVETELTAKIDGVRTDLTARIDGAETELKADIATLAAELRAIRREFAFFRWLLIILIAFLTLLVAYG